MTIEFNSSRTSIFTNCIVYYSVMRKYFILFSIAFLTFFSAVAQNGNSYRYKDFVFPDITIEKNLVYDGDPVSNKKNAHAFDLYQPKADSAINRPLIIWMHGGGFKYGSKEAKSMKIWCASFARRGYVCVAINYRLSKRNPVFHFDQLLTSSYYAVMDAKKAVEFFRKNHLRYGINPDKIILAGNSAGGIIALQAAFATDKAFGGMAKVPDTTENAGNAELPGIAGVINFWGAIFNLDWLKNAHTPIVSVLGSDDSLVPPTHKSAPLYGGIDIHNRADSLHLPNALKVYKGYSHELQRYFNPFFRSPDGTKKRWREAGQFAADFLYENVISK